MKAPSESVILSGWINARCDIPTVRAPYFMALLQNAPDTGKSVTICKSAATGKSTLIQSPIIEKAGKASPPSAASQRQTLSGNGDGS